jgi:hypothetical protein
MSATIIIVSLLVESRRERVLMVISLVVVELDKGGFNLSVNCVLDLVQLSFDVSDPLLKLTTAWVLRSIIHEVASLSRDHISC